MYPTARGSRRNSTAGASLGLVRLEGLYLKISHQTKCFQLDSSPALSWLCSQHVKPACQQNVLCPKAAKPSRKFWWCLLGRAPFTQTILKISKKSHVEVLHRAWGNQNGLVQICSCDARIQFGITSFIVTKRSSQPSWATITAKLSLTFISKMPFGRN